MLIFKTFMDRKNEQFLKKLKNTKILSTFVHVQISTILYI